MTETVKLTDHEFVALWDRYTGRFLPEPFTFLGRIPLQEDYERHARDIWERLGGDSFLAKVIRTVEVPDVYLVVQGWYDKEMDNPDKRIRIHAVRAGASAFVITQLPGETVFHSGGFVIAECQPRALAAAVVAALPEVGAGQRGPIPIVIETTRAADSYWQSRSLVEDEADATEERSKEFLDAPAARTGSITIHQGKSKFGRRGILERVLIWRDMPDDGRYVIPVGDNPVAVGVSAKRFVLMIDEVIDEIVKRLETHWETGDSEPLMYRHRTFG